MARARTRFVCLAPAMAAAGLAAQEMPSPAIDRTGALQIELPAQPPATGPRRAYLDENGAPAAPRASLVGEVAERLAPDESTAPARQISAHSDSGAGITQLSRADLNARLAQLSAAERQVLFQAIEGSDICNDPPRVAEIMALCRGRIETRPDEFSARADNPLSAEDRLLRGDLDASILPTLTTVIDRLGRSGASVGDPSNQAIAAIALGTGLTASDGKSDANGASTPQVGEETQALINALVNQLGGSAP